MIRMIHPIRRGWVLAGGFPALCSVLLVLAPSDAWAKTLLLSGATVHTVAGQTFAPGQVLIEGGKIAAVGTTVEAPGAEIINLSGQHLYPGLIALNTSLGLTEIPALRATQDTTEVGEFNPDVESWTAVNPDSELIPVARANGIACFQPVPAGGIVAGQSGLVAVEGWTTEERTIKGPAALDVYWPNMALDTTPRARARTKVKSLDEQAKERRVQNQSLADFFEEALDYARAKEASGRGKMPRFEKIPAWEAMIPYVRGELPIMIHADELRQIQAALRWASSNHFNIILAGGRDAWKVAELLAAKQIRVVYSHIYQQPARDSDGYDVNFRAPEVLRQAGVQVAFGLAFDSFNASLLRNLPYVAAQAMAFGLPEADALKGLTLYPAKFLGVADRLGSLESGKEATLFAADGDILDIRSNVKRMWIAGKEISLETRHTRLYERYKNRPKSNPSL